MRTGISITVKPSDRKRLKAILKNRNTAQKHAWRAEIVLLSAEGLGTNEIMRRTGKSKTCVWRWQERYMQEGITGLLRDKTRPSRITPLGPEVAARVVSLTSTKPPGERTHWTGTLMAGACGISASAVHRIWRAHGLQPHKVKRFKLPMIQSSWRSCATWWGSMSIRQPTPSFCRSMKRAKSRQWTALSPAFP